jgi:hypothetical protein
VQLARPRGDPCSGQRGCSGQLGSTCLDLPGWLEPTQAARGKRCANRGDVSAGAGATVPALARRPAHSDNSAADGQRPGTADDSRSNDEAPPRQRGAVRRGAIRRGLIGNIFRVRRPTTARAREFNCRIYAAMPMHFSCALSHSAAARRWRSAAMRERGVTRPSLAVGPVAGIASSPAWAESIGHQAAARYPRGMAASRRCV